MEPGTYTVGRNDGTVSPFFVLLDDDNHPECHFDQDALLQHACDNPTEWWWQIVEIPDDLPPDSVLESMPDPRSDDAHFWRTE